MTAQNDKPLCLKCPSSSLSQPFPTSPPSPPSLRSPVSPPSPSSPISPHSTHCVTERHRQTECIFKYIDYKHK